MVEDFKKKLVPNRWLGVSFLFEQDKDGLRKVGERFSPMEQWESLSEVKMNITQSVFCLDGCEFPPSSFVAVALHTVGEKCGREATLSAHCAAPVHTLVPMLTFGIVI